MEQIIHNLRQVLGTAFSLYLSTHGAHWNVEGKDFYQFHNLFKDQYEEIWESLDGIAEQLRALDSYAPASMAEYLTLSLIDENPQNGPLILQGALLTLCEDHEVLIDLMAITIQMADEANQQGLVNFLGGRIEAHQKHRWMLRSSAR
jgi:starvation-inducible DNA-binding protein